VLSLVVTQMIIKILSINVFSKNFEKEQKEKNIRQLILDREIE